MELALNFPRAAETEDTIRKEDGLLYCKKCGRRRERLIEAEGFPPMIVAVMCECEEQDQENDKQEKAERERLERIARLKKAGLSDTLYTRCTFDRDDGRNEAQTDKARRYVDHFLEAYRENLGMLIYGTLGSGKTFMAGCIANELLDRGISVKMTSLQRLIEAANADYGDGREEVLDEVANVQLLILDDFGTERHTEYMNEQIYEIINTRYKAQLPLIITTNLDKEDLENCDNLDRQRIYDRINEMCLFIKFNGESRRPEIKASKRALAANIFGGAA